jgi:hypothetical protein
VQIPIIPVPWHLMYQEGKQSNYCKIINNSHSYAHWILKCGIPSCRYVFNSHHTSRVRNKAIWHLSWTTTPKQGSNIAHSPRGMVLHHLQRSSPYMLQKNEVPFGCWCRGDPEQWSRGCYGGLQATWTRLTQYTYPTSSIRIIK